jgi:sugar/nucleoside kinase (ribokinase family)
MGKETSLHLDLLVVGELNMDLILNNIEGFPDLGKEKVARDFNLTMGSSSAIFAANISRLGTPTAFCGLIGQDSFGNDIVEQLQEFNIDTSFIARSQQHQTGCTVIFRYNNDRAMLTYPGAMEYFGLGDIPDEAFQKARHLHISSIFLQPAIKKDLLALVKRAKSNDMTISIDPQWDPQENWDIDLEALFKHIDLFLPNEDEFLQLAQAETVSKGLQKVQHPTSNCTIVVKRGIDGASYLDTNGSIHTVPAFENSSPVDAVGAGDSFNAGFVYQYLKGNETQDCIRFGNITGAVSTTESGGTAAIRSLKHVHDIAKQKFSINDLAG